MPRYKRKNRYHRKNKDENGDAPYYNPSSGPLSLAEKALLLKYLLDYKSGCERVCFPQDFCPSDEETIVTAPASTSRNNDGHDESFIEIANSRFPALTEQVLGLPYLALPKTLTAKQRYAIHEMCVDGK